MKLPAGYGLTFKEVKLATSGAQWTVAFWVQHVAGKAVVMGDLGQRGKGGNGHFKVVGKSVPYMCAAIVEAKYRTKAEAAKMSNGDCRNILIVDLCKATKGSSSCFAKTIQLQRMMPAIKALRGKGNDDLLKILLKIKPNIKTAAGPKVIFEVLAGNDKKEIKLAKKDKSWYFLTVVGGKGKTTVFVDGYKKGVLNHHEKKHLSLLATVDGSTGGLPIDELRVYATVLSHDEIQKSMDTTLSGNEVGLEVYYMFDEAEGDILYDQANIDGAAHNEGQVQANKHWKGGSTLLEIVAENTRTKASPMAKESDAQRAQVSFLEEDSEVDVDATVSLLALGATTASRTLLTRRTGDKASAFRRHVAGLGHSDMERGQVELVDTSSSLSLLETESALSFGFVKKIFRPRVNRCWHKRYSYRTYEGSRYSLWNGRRGHINKVIREGGQALAGKHTKFVNFLKAATSKWGSLNTDINSWKASFHTHSKASNSRLHHLQQKYKAIVAHGNKLRSMWLASGAGIETSAAVAFAGPMTGLGKKNTVYPQLDIDSDFHWQSAAIRIVTLGDAKHGAQAENFLETESAQSFDFKALLKKHFGFIKTFLKKLQKQMEDRRKAQRQKELLEQQRRVIAKAVGSGPMDAFVWRNQRVADAIKQTGKDGWGNQKKPLLVFLNGVAVGVAKLTSQRNRFNTFTYDLTRAQMMLLKPGVNEVYVTGSNQAVPVFAVIKAEVKTTNGFLELDGKKSFAQVNFGEQLATSMKSDFTVEAWVKLPAARGGNRRRASPVLSRGGDGKLFWVLYDTGKAGAGFRVNWEDGRERTENGKVIKYATSAVENYNVPRGEWFHYAAVFDDLFLGVYINGKRVAETEIPDGGSRVVAGYGVETPLLVGAIDTKRAEEDARVKRWATPEGSRLLGAVDDVLVWGEGRSGQQIQSDAQTEAWGKPVVGGDADLAHDFRRTAQGSECAGAAVSAETFVTFQECKAACDEASECQYIAFAGNEKTGGSTCESGSRLDQPERKCRCAFINHGCKDTTANAAYSLHKKERKNGDDGKLLFTPLMSFDFQAGPNPSEENLGGKKPEFQWNGYCADPPSQMKKETVISGRNDCVKKFGTEACTGDARIIRTCAKACARAKCQGPLNGPCDSVPNGKYAGFSVGLKNDASTSVARCRCQDRAASKCKNKGGTNTAWRTYDMVDATMDDAPTMDTSSVDGQEGITISLYDAQPISKVVHIMEKHVWKDCPGARLGEGETDVEICGGQKGSKVMGKCILSEGTPRCFCAPNVKGETCSQMMCAPQKQLGACSSAGYVGKDDRARGTCVENLLWKPPPAKQAKGPKGGPGYCQCKKGSKGGTLFVGSKCEHECPNSKDSECGGHGKCKAETSQEGEGEDAQSNTKAVCDCQPGFFGAGCEKACPGINDKGGAGVCGGHGVCGHENEQLTGHGVELKCLCNEIGGWFPHHNAGGSCALSCPGAASTAEAPVSKASDGSWNAEAQWDGVCNARGHGRRAFKMGKADKMRSGGKYQKVPPSRLGCFVGAKNTPEATEPGVCRCDLESTNAKANAEAKQNNGAGPKTCAGVQTSGKHFGRGRWKGNMYSAQYSCACDHGDGSYLGGKTNWDVDTKKLATSSATELLRDNAGWGVQPSCLDRRSIVGSDVWKKTLSPGQRTRPPSEFDGSGLNQCGRSFVKTNHAHESHRTCVCIRYC